MPHIPYGYKIVDGKAVIDEEQAERVRTLFEGYISGLALKTAAEKAGLQIFHGSAGRMFRNTHYLGDEYYPAIIEKELFDKAEEIRIARAGKLGRIRELEKVPDVTVDTHFFFFLYTEKLSEPLVQAGYEYSLIEFELERME